MANKKTPLQRPLVIEAGGLRIDVHYRHRGQDEGPSFEVYDSAESEVLRFDCFKLRPHFHLIGPKREKIERIDKKALDPVRWTLQRLKRDLRSFLWKAGHRKLARGVDQAAIARALRKAEGRILELGKVFPDPKKNRGRL